MTTATSVDSAWARGLYLVSMVGGAALSMARGFLVAALLAVADFGMFAIFVAIVAFVSPLIGLGQIEECRKRFPRLVSGGRAAEIPGLVDQLMILCAKRTAWVAGPAVLSLLVLDHRELALMAAAAAILLVGTAWVGVLSSALRSGDTVVYLGVTTLLRSVAAVLIVGAGTYSYGLQGALAGEAMAAFAAGVIMRAFVCASLRNAVPLQVGQGGSQAAQPVSAATGVSTAGLLLFGSWMMASVPTYLNRPVVAALYDPHEMGTFAFLGLLMTAAMTGFAITEQISGPKLIRMQYDGIPITRQIRFLLSFICLIELILIVSLFLAFIIINTALFQTYFGKYDMRLSFFMPVAITCLLLVSPKIDWLFIAQDREIYSTMASLVYVIFFTASCFVSYIFEFSFETFLWIIMASKAVHIAVQAGLIFRMAHAVR